MARYRLGAPPQFDKRRKKAIEGYRKFAMEGKGLTSPLKDSRHPLLLGDDALVERDRVNKKPEELREVSKAHQRS